jgi:hypothetical protein
MANADPKMPTTANGLGHLVAQTQEERRSLRNRIIASRVEALWNFAILWPAKYRNAIEACLVVDEDFDRTSLQRSVE